MAFGQFGPQNTYYHVISKPILVNPLSSFHFETVKAFILKFENIGLF